MAKNPAVDVAKEMASQDDSSQTIALKTGVRVRLVPVSTALIDEVTSRIKDPDVPVWHNEAKGRDEPNPNDPKYLSDLVDANRRRGIAVYDAMVMFGVELVDGVPDDDGWLTKLRYLERRGQIDLSTYDLDDPFDKEFVYKRYVAVDNETLARLGRMSAFTQEEVTQAEAPFRRN